MVLIGLVARPVTAGSMTPDIVGGEPTRVGEYPFMAAILDDSITGSDWSKQFCGGSLIAPRWVLTAAHCVDGRSAKDLAVAVGRTRLDSDQGVRVDVAAIEVHPDWHSPRFYSHDVALLRLESRAGRIDPIGLPSIARDEFEAPGTSLTVIGWGNTEPSGDARFPDGLHEVVVPAVADPSCRSVYGSSFDPPTMLCAGEKGIDSCQGDSGGPLFAEVSGEYVQVGTVSFGIGCAKRAHPGVYGEIDNSSIRSWITEISGV
jgi:secreted trypsin-like serine protease